MKAFYHKSVVKSSKFSRLRRATQNQEFRYYLQFNVYLVLGVMPPEGRRKFLEGQNLSVREKAIKKHCLEVSLKPENPKMFV